MSVERIPIEEYHGRLKAQGVSAREHAAVICPICKTVQSIASLRRAGATEAQIDKMVGFSCEGRFTNAGPWPSSKDHSRKAETRRKVRGCDWTLGGLFQLHDLEVEFPDGTKSPAFVPASPEAAQALEREISAAAAA